MAKLNEIIFVSILFVCLVNKMTIAQEDPYGIPTKINENVELEEVISSWISCFNSKGYVNILNIKTGDSSETHFQDSK